MAKDQLDKIHRHCQKVADITKQCQDEEKIEHQYMQEIDDNIHSSKISDSFNSLLLISQFLVQIIFIHFS